jgi:hypothetical protein
MPTTPPTIVAPLPNDPRVMLLAQATGLTRREAFGAAAEAWAWLAVMATDDAIVKATPDALTALVDVAGFGSAMITAGLVGVVDDGLVLPVELRHRQQRDARGGVATAGDEDPGDARRKALNAEAARRYRKRARGTGSKTKSAVKSYRTLGFVAGHEVRAFEGRFGPYAMVLGAMLGGETFRKLTAGAKDKALEAVTLADVLPGIVEKAKGIHEREQGIRDASKRKALVPSYDSLRAAAERHHDEDDASRRHDDASSLASSSCRQDSRHNPNEGHGLDAADASSSRHDDGLSSMSSSSSSLSFSRKKKREEEEEEEIKKRWQRLPRHLRREFEGSMAAAHKRWWSIIESDAGDEKKVPDPSAAAADLGLTKEEVRQLGVREAWIRFQHNLLNKFEAGDATVDREAWEQRLRQVGAAEAPSKPEEARDGIQATADTTTGDKPDTGIVVAHNGDGLAGPAPEPREALPSEGVVSARVNASADERDAFEPADIISMTTNAACGPT